MPQIEGIKGFPNAEGNRGDEGVHDANAMAQVELFKPPLGLLRIARLQVKNGLLRQRFAERSLLLFIAGPEQEFHPHQHWDAHDLLLNGREPDPGLLGATEDLDQDIGIQHDIDGRHDGAARPQPAASGRTQGSHPCPFGLSRCRRGRIAGDPPL